MLRNRVLELTLAAAAALGYGCGSPEDPSVQSTEPSTPVQAIRLDIPPQGTPKAENKDETPKAEVKAETPKAPVASKLPQNTPQAGVPHESWKAVPIGDTAEKGLKWLVSVQGKDGGWGQDGGNEGDNRKDVGLESNGND